SLRSRRQRSISFHSFFRVDSPADLAPAGPARFWSAMLERREPGRSLRAHRRHQVNQQMIGLINRLVHHLQALIAVFHFGGFAHFGQDVSQVVIQLSGQVHPFSRPQKSLLRAVGEQIKDQHRSRNQRNRKIVHDRRRRRNSESNESSVYDVG